MLTETLTHRDEWGSYRSPRGRVLAEQTELGDRLLALHIPGESLDICLNQAWCHEFLAATLFQLPPRVPVNLAGTERIAIPLYRSQVAARLRHLRALQISVWFEVNRVEWGDINDVCVLVLGDLLKRRDRLRTATSTRRPPRLVPSFATEVSLTVKI